MSFKVTVKLDDKVTSIDGEEILTSKTFTSKEQVPLTVKRAIIIILSSEFPDDKFTGEEKMERFRLTEKVYKSTSTVELTYDEVKIIKLSAVKAVTSRVYGVVMNAIDPDNEVKV